MNNQPQPLNSGPGEKIFKPFISFMKLETSGGIVLIFTTILALIWANSPFAESYHHLWETKFSLSFGPWGVSKQIHHWINDGLMAIFFFVVGLEIKREVFIGELSTMRKAILPIFAAIGGMVIPALIYVIINWGGEGKNGWGVPMATDIAFALGVLALLGNRIPLSIKVFLTALAIIDDIGAVLVIAIFYTSEINTAMLVLTAALCVVLFIINKLDVHHPVAYLIIGIILWFTLLESGLHATIAGIIVAMGVPARAKIDSKGFLDSTREHLDKFEKTGVSKEVKPATEEQLAILHTIHKDSEHLESPVQRLEHAHHPYTTYFIIPLFALANAGVHLDFEPRYFTHPITLGVFLGLILGKQFGVVAFSWLAVKLNIASKPEGVSWLQIYGVSWLAAIGFTMSLFVTNLAFKGDEFLQMSKIGVLGASLIAGIIGFVILRCCSEKNPAND